MESIKEKTVKGFFWTGSSKVVEQIVSWVITIILARLLFPTDYGLMAMAMIFMQFFDHFREFSIGGAIVQRKDIDEACISSAFWFLCITGCIAFLLVYVTSDFVGIFFSEERLPEILVPLGLTLILSSLTSVPISLLSKELHFEKLALIRILSTSMMGIVSVTFAFLGHGVWSLVYGSITNNLVTSILSYYYSKLKPALAFSFKDIKPLFSFGIPMTGSKFLNYLIQNADYFIVGKFLGGELLGYYFMAFNLSAKPLRQLSLMINAVNYPVFSKLQDRQDALKSHFLRTTRYITLIVFPSLVGLFLIAEDFVISFLGEKWLPMVPPFKILSIVGIFKCLQVVITPLLYGKGKSAVVFKYSSVSTVVLTLSFLVGVNFGISGVALSWLVAFPPLLIYILRICLKEIDVSWDEYIRCMVPPITATIIMAASVVVFQAIAIDNRMLKMVISILVGCVSYLSFLWFVHRDLSSELKDVISLLVSSRLKA